MKIVLLFLFVVFLFSCEKESIDCWVCKVDAVTIVGGKITGTVSTFTYPCDISTERIFEYEVQGTTTTTIDLLQAGYACIHDVEVVSVTNCKKK